MALGRFPSGMFGTFTPNEHRLPTSPWSFGVNPRTHVRGVLSFDLPIRQAQGPEALEGEALDRWYGVNRKMNHPAASSGVSQSSVPRRRESRHEELDTRFRGYDKRSKLRGI